MTVAFRKVEDLTNPIKSGQFRVDLEPTGGVIDVEAFDRHVGAFLVEHLNRFDLI